MPCYRHCGQIFDAISSYSGQQLFFYITFLSQMQYALSFRYSCFRLAENQASLVGLQGDGQRGIYGDASKHVGSATIEIIEM